LTPDGQPGGLSVGVATLRRITIALWLTVVAVQVVIWAVGIIVSGDISFPWWTWSVGSGSLFVGVVWWLTEPTRRNPPDDGNEP
jgi:hypothetical protein